MGIRNKMKTFGVNLSDVSDAMPDTSYSQICNVLNIGLTERIVAAADKLCEEKKDRLRLALEM